MAKAVTALTLDKEYRQDEALDWGYLTRAEVSHRLRRTGGGGGEGRRTKDEGQNSGRGGDE
jgi:hypothetical protein